MRTLSTHEEGAAISRGLEAAASEVLSLRRLAAHRALVTGAAAVLAALVAAVDSRFAVALGVGSIAEGLLTFVVLSRRRDLLLALASDRNAYALADVRHFGASLVAPRRRLSVARTIADVLRESGEPHSLYVVDRVAAEAPALVAIAQALANHATVIEPTAMAALLRLLTDSQKSPLLNPAAPSDKLGEVVAAVLAGIHPRAAPAE